MCNLINISNSLLPTNYGEFRIHILKDVNTNIEHIALTKGDVVNGENVLTRVHSECVTGDIFSSLRCDCGEQLIQSLIRVNKEGLGLVVYIRDHEGRGIGLANKIKAYHLQECGLDTVEANIALGFPVDGRSYLVASEIIHSFNIRSIYLLTNNPLKALSLSKLDVTVSKQLPLIVKENIFNSSYLQTKRVKLNHLI
ncbi:GTP cyclohydrolase II [Methylotenera sp.]|uniref:GTP cyclohydrolase II n=1 Tax=Methylotenera sp. TaxID=2051956 RepID=UPI00273528B0|nr:GTP cyclohydrolase II [Methylotenera sp.]MDP3777667.1 GTP cyclohydrolase II [Methylotenera sp.]